MNYHSLICTNWYLLLESQLSESEYDYTYGISDDRFKEIQEQMERNKVKAFAVPNLNFAKIQSEPVSVNSKSVLVISQTILLSLSCSAKWRNCRPKLAIKEKQQNTQNMEAKRAVLDMIFKRNKSDTNVDNIGLPLPQKWFNVDSSQVWDNFTFSNEEVKQLHEEWSAQPIDEWKSLVEVGVQQWCFASAAYRIQKHQRQNSAW